MKFFDGHDFEPSNNEENKEMPSDDNS